MLVYYTYASVNQDFNADILINKYINWLQNSKNKMKGLKYDHSYHFQYTIEKKTLRIKDFEDYCILGLQFITSDNRMGMTFVVEVMYDYGNNIIELYFYHEFNDGTKKSLPNISIPNIFRDLLNSEYVLDDYDLKINDEAAYMNQYRLNKAVKQNYRLPLIVLYKNKRCLLPPNLVAKKLYGIGHVVICNTDRDPYVKIYYPNKQTEIITEDYNLLTILFDKIRFHLIDHNSGQYSFNDLVNKMKLDQHHSNIESFKEYEKLSKDVTDELMYQINALTIDNTELTNEVIQLRKKLNDLETYCLLLNEKSALVTSSDDHKEKREYILKVIHQTLRDLSDNQHRYRKKDVFESILEKENEVLKHKG